MCRCWKKNEKKLDQPMPIHGLWNNSSSNLNLLIDSLRGSRSETREGITAVGEESQGER